MVSIGDCSSEVHGQGCLHTVMNSVPRRRTQSLRGQLSFLLCVKIPCSCIPAAYVMHGAVAGTQCFVESLPCLLQGSLPRDRLADLVFILMPLSPGSPACLSVAPLCQTSKLLSRWPRSVLSCSCFLSVSPCICCWLVQRHAILQSFEFSAFD